MLKLDSDSAAAWRWFHDTIEVQLGFVGELHEVRDVASKAADNVARLAALMSHFEAGSTATIAASYIDAAARIVAWHLSEARRFLGGLAASRHVADAQQLQGWLIRRCRATGAGHIQHRTVQQYVTPTRLREPEALDAAVEELKDAGRLRQVHEHEGRRRVLVLNPALLERKAE